jgi:hypothetical protein
MYVCMCPLLEPERLAVLAQYPVSINILAPILEAIQVGLGIQNGDFLENAFHDVN